MDLKDPGQAEEFIKTQLAEQPDRLAHVLGVAKRVRESASKIADLSETEIDADLAYCAALLHDVGYAPCAVKSGFHPLDGYEYLKEQGFTDLADIIVGHSSSPEEAKLRGVTLIEPLDSLEAKLITYWDMQVKQGGEIVSYQERLDDICSRYGEASPVSCANLAAKARIDLIFQEIEGLLAAGE